MLAMTKLFNNLSFVLQYYATIYYISTNKVQVKNGDKLLLKNATTLSYHFQKSLMLES